MWPTEASEYQLRARCLEGQLLLAQGQPGEALAALAEARQLADAMGARLFLWPLEISLADGHQAAGRDELAGPAYQRAWATLQSIADTLPGHAARASMQALPLACRLQARLEEQA